MNKFEFIVAGKMMFGTSWKDDMARMLDFSVKAKTVNKISTGEKNITVAVALDVIEAMRLKVKALNNAIALLEQQTKIKTQTSKTLSLYINEDGIWHTSIHHQDIIDNGAIVLKNIEIQIETLTNADDDLFKVNYNYEFQNKVITESYKRTKVDGDYDTFVQLIKSYFDLPVNTLTELDEIIAIKKSELLLKSISIVKLIGGDLDAAKQVYDFSKNKKNITIGGKEVGLQELKTAIKVVEENDL